jgi:hypothetical protein
MRRAWRIRDVLVPGTALAVIACGTAPGSQPSGLRTAPGGRTASKRVVTVDEKAGHRTVTIRQGTEIDVRLHSTYWRFSSLRGSVLRSLGAPAYKPRLGGSCVPGQGCGTVTSRYRANRPGRKTIRASRTSCGEALRCTHGAGSFRVTIRVLTG